MPSHTELEIARAHRSALQGRLVRLTAERKRLTGVEHAGSAAQADLDALGRQEVDAVRAWAATASSDPAPAPDAARRHALMIAVAASEAQSAAARSAGAALDVEIGEASRDLAQIAGQIEVAAVDQLADAFVNEVEALRGRASALQSDIARAYAVIAVIRDLADEHQMRDRANEARRIFNLLERLGGRAIFDVAPTQGQVAGHVPALSARLADLIR